MTVIERCERCGERPGTSRYGGVILLCDQCALDARVPEVKALREQLQGAVEALERIAKDAEALAAKGEQISTTWVAAGVREALDMLRGQ